MSLGIYQIQQRLVYFVVFLDSPQSRLTPFYPCSLVQSNNRYNYAAKSRHLH